MLPILALAAVLGVVLIDRERDAAKEEFRVAARGVLQFVDDELRHNLDLVTQLAAAPALARGDMAGFGETVEWMRKGRDTWHAIAVYDAQTVRQLYNSMGDVAGLGTPPKDPASVRRVVDEGLPVVGNLAMRGVSIDHPFVPLRAPVLVGGQVRYVVSVAMIPTHFLRLVRREAGEGRQLVAIIDNGETIVARSDGDFTGQRSNTAGLGDPETVLEGPGQDGRLYVRAITRSKETGWRVGLGVTAEVFHAPQRRMVGLVAVLGLAAAAASSVLAVLLGRNIRRRAAREQQGVEEEMRVNHERLLTALALREMIVADYDAELRYTWIHDSAFGREPAMVAGRTDYDFFDTESADLLTRLYRDARDNLTEGWAELALRHKGEIKVRHFDVVVAPRVGRDGTFHGLTCAFLSIDEEIDIRERLEDALAAAGRADFAKSRFLASASHDLRQPFQAMRLYHHVLEMRAPDPKTRQALDALGRAMTAGEELLSALLDVSTLEAGTVQPVTESLSLADILYDVASEYGEIASQRALRLKVMPIQATISSDRVLLKRVVRNLVNNALRYTERGGILLGARRRGEHVLIQVWDTGQGIPADRLQDIFEDFYQLDNPSRDRSRGLGLGLSIVQRTVRLLGHEITVNSRLGRGSVFTVRVPLAGEPPDLVSVVGG
jgi:signal transduction histidine kinase